MSETDTPRNRKERRAAAKESGTKFTPMDYASQIPMLQPDRSGPKSRTLFDLAEERQAQMDAGQPFNKHFQVDDQGRILDEPSDPLGPVGDAIFFNLTLAMLHFTLDVLCYSQYRQDIEWAPIAKRTATVLPVLFFVTYSLRSELANRFSTAKQVLCAIMGAAAGCYLIYIGNTYSYYAVMKQAPPVGVLWVFSVIEMGLPYAVASLSVNVAFLWLRGYTVF